LKNEWSVVGVDAMTNYYDVTLKNDRYKILKKNDNFYGYIGFIQDEKLIDKICNKHKPDIIIHLAAQAGVRYSINNPLSYVEENLIGTFHILEIARKHSPNHLLIASTSSVYGNNKIMPFHEKLKSDTPISFYAATKKSNEVMAHSYSHLYKIPTTIFRFFTVYGPWGRPDMALFKFTKQILSGNPIEIYNYGDMKRDFTNINDLVEAVTLLINKIPPNPEQGELKIDCDSISETAPFRIVNIGSSKPVALTHFIQEIENSLGLVAEKKFVDMQEGDVDLTFSDISLLRELTGFQPKISLSKGISEFVNWYKFYYK
jgi:UDP-glucuronate 4-epimerase